MDDAARSRLKAIPLCRTKAGPRDGDLWIERLKEEYQAIIKFVQNNKESDSDWFRLESSADGTKWFGKCWHYHNMVKYEFDVEFDIPITYPVTAPEIALPELDGKTAKNRQLVLFPGSGLQFVQGRNVSRWENLFIRSFQAIVGEKRSEVRYCTRFLTRTWSVVGGRNPRFDRKGSDYSKSLDTAPLTIVKLVSPWE
ncbi:hypothetical protein RB195_012507 [Necator americanus]|uniref:Ubiquitin-fold modifier-conjugating enzyme 1 n=1 Tax=Necator americanus TaxID=51031 RepID=A0ABR1D8A4_NECAM